MVSIPKIFVIGKGERETFCLLMSEHNQVYGGNNSRTCLIAAGGQSEFPLDDNRIAIPSLG